MGETRNGSKEGCKPEKAVAKTIAAVPSTKGLEPSAGKTKNWGPTEHATSPRRPLSLVKSVLETASVEFVPRNGGGAGVRSRDRVG